MKSSVIMRLEDKLIKSDSERLSREEVMSAYVDIHQLSHVYGDLELAESYEVLFADYIKESIYRVYGKKELV